MSWRRGYRVACILGTCLVTVAAVQVANHPQVEGLTVYLFELGTGLDGSFGGPELFGLLLMYCGLIFLGFHPLYHRLPVHAEETVQTIQSGVLVAILVLIGFAYTGIHSLRLTTLVTLFGILLGILPVWFLLLRWTFYQPNASTGVDDDG